MRSTSTVRALAATAFGTADPLNPTVITVVEAVLCALVAALQHLPSARDSMMWFVAAAWGVLAIAVSVIRLGGAAAFGARRRHVEKDGDLFTALLLIAALFAISLAVGALRFS